MKSRIGRLTSDGSQSLNCIAVVDILKTIFDFQKCNPFMKINTKIFHH